MQKSNSTDTTAESESGYTKDDLTKVRHSAVRLLARREHGRCELRNKLLTRGHSAAAIEEVLDQLADRGLQCDQRFAESYTRMRYQRGYGGNKILSELQSRELSQCVIDGVLSDYQHSWVDNAEAALKKKYSEHQILNCEFRELAKMQRFLWSRGYNSADIRTALERIRQPQG